MAIVVSDTISGNRSCFCVWSWQVEIGVYGSLERVSLGTHTRDSIRKNSNNEIWEITKQSREILK